MTAKAKAANGHAHLPVNALSHIRDAVVALEGNVKGADGEPLEPEVAHEDLLELVENLVEKVYGGKITYTE